MPAVIPCSPETLKDILLLYGYRIYRQDMLNWSLVKNPAEPPVIVAKRGRFISLDALYLVFAQTGMTPMAYLILKAQVEGTGKSA